jgi:hypothetical protein
MHCGKCGREIGTGEKSLSTTSEAGGAPFVNQAYLPGTRTVPLVLCKECAANQGATMRTFLWSLAFLVMGLTVVGLLIRVLGF